MNKNPGYCGRFAPSPSGPLHFGSLVAAVGSYLDARSVGGSWLIRIEDLDPPREVPGAADNILRTLEQLGMHWDKTVLYQSQRKEAYRDALSRLEKQGLIYPCGCSRKDIRELARGTGSRAIYPGTCRNGIAAGIKPRSLRLRVDNATIQFRDRLLGAAQEYLPEQVGDFVVQRTDGLTAYQLAVVVDDAAQGITDVVRGSDLFDTTCRQIYLQQLIGVNTPGYLHLPVATWPNGDKFSKQTQAPAINTEQGTALLVKALCFLGQVVPDRLADEDLATFWQLAANTWDTSRIPVRRTICVDFRNG